MVVTGQRIMKIKEVLKFAIESDNDQLLDLIHELNSMKPNELGYSEVEKEIAELYCKATGNSQNKKVTNNIDLFLNKLYCYFQKFDLVFSEFEKYYSFEILQHGDLIAEFRLAKSKLEANIYKVTCVKMVQGSFEEHHLFQGVKFEYYPPLETDDFDLSNISELHYISPVKSYNLQQDLVDFADYDLELDWDFISQYRSKYRLEDFKWYNPKNNIKYFGRKWKQDLISQTVSTSVSGLIPEREYVDEPLSSVEKWVEYTHPDMLWKHVNNEWVQVKNPLAGVKAQTKLPGKHYQDCHSFNSYSQVVSPEKYKLKGDLCPFWYQSQKAKYVCFVSQFPVSMMQELSKHQLDIELQVIIKFMVTQTKTEKINVGDGLYGSVDEVVKVKTTHFIPKVWFKMNVPQILQSKNGKFSSKDCYKFQNIAGIVRRFYE